jgi:hypothetical protein
MKRLLTITILLLSGFKGFGQSSKANLYAQHTIQCLDFYKIHDSNVINGKVKSIKEIKYIIDTIIANDTILIKKEETLKTYDGLGNIIEENVYNTDGRLSFRNVFKYNLNQEIGSIETFTLEGFKGKLTHLYNDMKHPIVTFYNESKDDYFDYSYKFEYDENDKLYQIEQFDGDSNLVKSYVITYFDNPNKAIYIAEISSLKEKVATMWFFDIKDNLTKKKIYYGKGNRPDLSIYYTYDTFDNLINRAYAGKKEKSTLSVNWKYEFDANLNWTKKMEYLKDVPLKIIKRQILYYN